MGNTINRAFVETLGNATADTFRGGKGELFWEPTTTSLRIGDGTPGGVEVAQQTAPIDYREFYAGFNSFYGTDPSVQQIIISKSATAGYNNQTTNTDNDDFYAIGLEGSPIVVALNVYGSSSTTALTTTAISTFVKAFIDAVMYNGEVALTNVDDIKTAFYANIDALIAQHLPENSLYQNFEFLNGDVWPNNNISDGGNDQYDEGNFLNTNLSTQLSYNDGNPVYNSPAVNGGDYVVLYKNSIFAFVGTNIDISKFYYSGGMGADGSGDKVVKALFGSNSLAVNLGNLRVATWGYPGNTPVRLTNQHYGESILIQSTDEPGGSNGRSALRWHIRPEPDGQGSRYSQVVVDNQGTRINNSDWSGSQGVWNWNFDNYGNFRLPNLQNGGGNIYHGDGTAVVALDSANNKIIGDNSNKTVPVGYGQTQDVPNFSGMLMVNDHYDGGVELWICGGNGAVLVSSTRPGYAGTVAINGSVAGYTWTNAANLNGPFTFTVIKTRNGC